MPMQPLCRSLLHMPGCFFSMKCTPVLPFPGFRCTPQTNVPLTFQGSITSFFTASLASIRHMLRSWIQSACSICTPGMAQLTTARPFATYWLSSNAGGQASTDLRPCQCWGERWCCCLRPPLSVSARAAAPLAGTCSAHAMPPAHTARPALSCFAPQHHICIWDTDQGSTIVSPNAQHRPCKMIGLQKAGQIQCSNGCSA